MSRTRSLRCLIYALLLAAAFFSFAGNAYAGKYDRVIIDSVKTSIYIGNVTLVTTPLIRTGDVYSAEYHAKVFPYFFSNEKGRLWITFTDEDLDRLAKGQAVFFKGHAEDTDHEPRRIEGRALPADATQGKIKVRVFVTEKIQLIFNAKYHFG